MKHVVLLIAFLSVGSIPVLGQAGHAGQEKNLRGLKGLRLVVMFARTDTMEEAEQAAILKLVEADATAKLENAGIPLLRFANEVEDAGSPQLIVYHVGQTKRFCIPALNQCEVAPEGSPCAGPVDPSRPCDMGAIWSWRS